MMTSNLPPRLDEHLRKDQLLETDQRGAREGVRGTVDNLPIDKTVLDDVRDKKYSMSCAFTGV